MYFEREAFFQSMDNQCLAVTFDDVRLQFLRSHVPAAETDLSTRFTRNVEMNSPLVSAAMDTVTMADMAIAMAVLGGIGTIPASLSIEEQKAEVRKVKLFMNGLIDSPKTAQGHETLEGVLKRREEFSARFRTFPVVDENNKFIGEITGDDFDFFSLDLQKTVFEAMTPAKEITTAPPGTSKEEAYRLMVANKRKTLPIVDEDSHEVVGLYTFSDVARLVGSGQGMYNTDSLGRLRVAAAVPTDPIDAVERMKELSKYVDAFVIDSAQGDLDYGFSTLRAMKEHDDSTDIMAGNLTDYESAVEFVRQGADGIKVGQGGGAICTTRPKTGGGTPQVTAVYECAKAIRDLNLDYTIPVCSDGGITNEGDLAIALAAGADSIMCGYFFAGTDESPGEVFQRPDGSKFKELTGMGSLEALKRNESSRRRYDASAKGQILAPEGVSAEVAYKGSVMQVGKLALQYLRRSLSYYNSRDIRALQENSRWRLITAAGMRESGVHNVVT